MDTPLRRRSRSGRRFLHDDHHPHRAGLQRRRGPRLAAVGPPRRPPRTPPDPVGLLPRRTGPDLAAVRTRLALARRADRRGVRQRVFTLGQMGWMATYPAELFPTAVRGTAITTVFNGTRFIAAAGALLSGSLVTGLGGISTAALTIGSIYVIGLFFALNAGPETRGKPLPD
ncbi:hypothetical protein NKH77_51720 [Streptomyces sp. M19]